MRASPYALTDVECTWIEAQCEQWIRFGRVAAERFIDRKKRILSFRPGAIFAFVDWKSNSYGTIHSSILIVQAATPGAPYTSMPYIIPGGDILLSIDGWPKVARVLEAIDAVEAAEIDPCDASPDHWRHVCNRLVTSLPFRPYTPERHLTWLRRKALEA